MERSEEEHGFHWDREGLVAILPTGATLFASGAGLASTSSVLGTVLMAIGGLMMVAIVVPLMTRRHKSVFREPALRQSGKYHPARLVPVVDRLDPGERCLDLVSGRLEVGRTCRLAMAGHVSGVRLSASARVLTESKWAVGLALADLAKCERMGRCRCDHVGPLLDGLKGPSDVLDLGPRRTSRMVRAIT